MLQGSVTDHVDKECPLQPVDCVFSWAGCKERPLRKDTELHTTDTKHMMILAVECGELRKEVKELKDENEKVKAENYKMKGQIATIHHIIAKDICPIPILPVTVTTESGIVHFYTHVGGIACQLN